MEDRAALEACRLFAGLPYPAVEILFSCSRGRDYSRGEMLIVPRQQLDWLGIVTRGRVHQIHLTAEGEDQLLEVIDSPRLVAEDLICTRTRLSPYHAMAAEDTRVLWLPASVILERGNLDELWRQEIQRRLLMEISHSNMKKEYRLAILAQRGLRQRILTYLTMQAEKHSSATVTIPFDREEMASFLCVNRSALSHELSRMEAEGLIAFRKNVFTLLTWEEVQWY